MADKVSSTIRMKVKNKGEFAEVKALITHPMENGFRKDQETGNLVPAHFIREIECQHNGQVVVTAVWGSGVSKNPYLAFQIKGANTGDSITLQWKDNKDQTDKVTVSVK